MAGRLRARHGLSLLWGTTVYLFGMGRPSLNGLKVPMMPSKPRPSAGSPVCPRHGTSRSQLGALIRRAVQPAPLRQRCPTGRSSRPSTGRHDQGHHRGRVRIGAGVILLRDHGPALVGHRRTMCSGTDAAHRPLAHREPPGVS